MSIRNQQLPQTPLLEIKPGETYDRAVERTLTEHLQTIAKLREDKRSSSEWKNILLLIAGLVLYLVLSSIM